MGIIPPITLAIAHLVLIMIDITAFFVGVRLIHRCRPTKMLSAFDDAGRPLVDGLTVKLAAWWTRIDSAQPLTEAQRLLASLGTLFVFRMLIGALLAAIF